MNLLLGSRGSLLMIVFPLLFSSVDCASDSQQQHPKSTFTFDQLWELEKTFWDSFLYPANVKQAQGNESSVFATNVG